MSELEAVIEKAAGGKMRPLPVHFLEGPTEDPRPGESPRASPQTKRGLGVLHCRSRRAGQQEHSSRSEPPYPDTVPSAPPYLGIPS